MVVQSDFVTSPKATIAAEMKWKAGIQMIRAWLQRFYLSLSCTFSIYFVVA
jgi:hypothetical protein